jgi:hypothetical protein
MTLVLSNGGGTQSAAIVALIARGLLEAPDYALIVDTGREKTATWDYYHAHLKPALEGAGCRTAIVPHSFATVDLYSHKGDILMPVYTTANGLGKLPTYCSTEWKRRPLLRWLRAQGVKEATLWLGFSTDEAERMKPSTEGWITHAYPLIEGRLSRDDCYSLVRRMGWPEPPKSSCFMCPHQGDKQWADLKVNHPLDFAAAAALERDIQARDPHVWLHRHAQPLDSLDFDPGQDGLFDACGGTSCWT